MAVRRIQTVPTVGTTISVTSSMWLLSGSKTQHYSIKSDGKNARNENKPVQPITFTGQDSSKSLKYQKYSLVPKPHHVQAKPLAFLHAPYCPWIFF